jgi:hypothetical protein
VTVCPGTAQRFGNELSFGCTAPVRPRRIETAMPALLEKLLAPEEEELARKKASLTALETQLADRELELAACRADLHHFEQHYLRTVGRRYVLL